MVDPWQKAIDELFDQTRALINFLSCENKVYPHRIAFNCLPHIDAFMPNGYTKEEIKMVNETRKILEDDTIGVTATTVRVPVFHSHSESVNVETKDPVSAREVKLLLENSPGIKVVDDPATNLYPLATDATPILFYINTLNNILTKHLIASFHIREIKICEHV